MDRLGELRQDDLVVGFTDDSEEALAIAVRLWLLHQKLDDGHTVRLIHTVYGQGYVLRTPDPPEPEEDRPPG